MCASHILEHTGADFSANDTGTWKNGWQSKSWMHTRRRLSDKRLSKLQRLLRLRERKWRRLLKMQILQMLIQHLRPLSRQMQLIEHITGAPCVNVLSQELVVACRCTSPPAYKKKRT
jgi:hypothetical protein